MLPPSLSYQPTFFDLPWRRKSIAWADTEMGEFIGGDLDKKHAGGGNGGGGSGTTKGGASLRYTDLADDDSGSESGGSADPKDAQDKDKGDKKTSPHKLERALKRNSVRSVSPYLGGSGFDVKRGSRVLI
ncbi:hypothetical protein GGTG_04224 [Gaeumannomyces tritici R3-111a-1]|uniref:Uncharacterized protein n=1 Tax=Gaeumannomyces tritici (strain R3-111a-1) TaxID=644352 RepID=J3NSH2_GAET3|nr:hypothetical protein GGTG_04224 [Gaeumannomyces tritici R3-111a-1]EJT79135.1 hypothetical protein GGTG_04224 [Gaeumannomyces tritici R3-111a-1]